METTPDNHSRREAAEGLLPLDLSRCHRFNRGFTYRRESFGGILYHYEGTRPDPHIMFVDHAFLIDLLDTLAANPAAPLGELVEAIRAHCALTPAQAGAVEGFLSTLIRQGALVPH